MSAPITLSDRQKAILLALWPTEATIPQIRVAMNADLEPGEHPITRNRVTTWRQKLGLPGRRPEDSTGHGFTRPINYNTPPMGRLPDPEADHQAFAGRRFEDARVPKPIGRVGRAMSGYGGGQSSIALFEGVV